MCKAKWIWYRSDFEIYHNMMLHNRRVDMGVEFPTKWHLCRPECAVKFRSSFTADEDFTLKIVSHGRGMVELTGDKFMRARPNEEFNVPKGKYNIFVEIYDYLGFPSIFCDSKYLKTDENWTGDRCDDIHLPVDCEPEYCSESDDPTVFPFSYRKITPVSQKSLDDGGVLYDFGDEMFGPVTIIGDKADDTIHYNYGESVEEALDDKYSIIHDTVSLTNGRYAVQPSAFRYIYVKSYGGANLSLDAQFEYLPIEDKASFECDDESVGKIWDMCSKTFHLNSREFYLDGIKRDRWVWSGDAYQSFMINRCLYDDPAIIKRTIKALLGRPPILQHINTINDYSAYLIISVWEYYFASGDKAFVQSIWEYLKELFDFIETRLIDGYVVEHEVDWVFIDWSDIDKTGAVCAEQILLWHVYNIIAKLSELCGEDGSALTEKAASFRERIINDYYDESRCAFIDSFESGKNHISRHANIFAILYDFVDDETARKIAHHVLYNDEITQITTPYFKLYELMAIGKLGDVEYVQKYIDSYWGGMAALGASTVWEEFNPQQNGAEHYSMYGVKYAKSLCHAWGSGPIYLLCRYVLGVYPTSVGGKSFTVAPNVGKYGKIHAKTPIGGGIVSVDYENGVMNVCASVSGGTLEYNGKKVSLLPNVTVTL